MIVRKNWAAYKSWLENWNHFISGLILPLLPWNSSFGTSYWRCIKLHHVLVLRQKAGNDRWQGKTRHFIYGSKSLSLQSIYYLETVRQSSYWSWDGNTAETVLMAFFALLIIYAMLFYQLNISAVFSKKMASSRLKRGLLIFVARNIQLLSPENYSRIFGCYSKTCL